MLKDTTSNMPVAAASATAAVVEDVENNQFFIKTAAQTVAAQTAQVAKTVRYIVLSDIHLGNRKNTTVEIVANMQEFLKPYDRPGSLDVLFLAGDVYDKLLDNTTDDLTESDLWIAWLTRFCHRNRIKLRVLEGTPSHDWKQSRNFDKVLKIQKFNPELDFSYVDKLHIEFMGDLGLTVLYVPDEWNVSTDQTFDEVTELLTQNHLTRVDIAIMHGSFGFQLPPMAHKVPRHDERKYLSIVRYYINVGHVHTFMVYDRILGQGSFDRLSHGQEEPKGGTLITLDPVSGPSFVFLENKQAKIYKTLALKSKDAESAVKEIERVVLKLPRQSYLRLKASKDHPAMMAFDQLRKKFIDVFLEKLTLEEEQDQQRVGNSDSDANVKPYHAIAITSDNIEDLLRNEVSKKHAFTDSQNAFFSKALKQAITNRS